MAKQLLNVWRENSGDFIGETKHDEAFDGNLRPCEILAA